MTDKELVSLLREKYIKSPPEGYSSSEIRNMSDSQILDMNYFLTEDEDFDDDFGEEGFYIF